jgi:sugar phosphate isomerase/epimerase
MASYEQLYPGATYLLDPSYNFLGYRVPAGSLGGTTSIQTANQLKEVSNLLNQGMKTTEVSVINPEVFEMMPKDHLKEINRLNKLAGAESTVHAPVLDPSGFTEQGWTEENRESVERQFTDFVDRSHEISPDGNVPVTLHASGVPGSLMIPKTHHLLTEEEKKKGEPVMGKMTAVDQESGKMINLEREWRFYPQKPEGKIYTPEEELGIANRSYWDNQLSQLIFYKERGDEILQKSLPFLEGTSPTEYNDRQKTAAKQAKNGEIYLDNTMMSLQNLYNQAYKYANSETQEQLKIAADAFEKDFTKVQELQQQGRGLTVLGNFSGAIQNMIEKMKNITSGHVVENGKIIKLEAPQQYVPIEEFTKRKASETLSNVAINSYKKFGTNAPIISIENPPYGSALATGKDLKELVQQTRKKFEDKLVKQGKSRSEAKNAAERLIGATWDTSHISMMRKQGFGPEQLVKETKAIAPYVKHLHYNDNFGSTHTDLPPGMGSVPMKDVLQVLEKAKFKGKRIFEGGNFFQHFRTSPFPYMLEHGGSSAYMMGGVPYWNQLGYLGAYYSGQGPINPGVHHSVYGAGFQNLPMELGGNITGDQGRFSGAPNQ